MAERILVPVDGTEDSEALLDLTADVARGGGATVRLLQVAPHAENVVDDDGHVVAYADEEASRLEADAVAYLTAAATKFPDTTVERAVRFGEPVTEILREAEAFGADLIAMTTRRPYRLRELALGTTADEVCRRADVPVLLLRPAPVHAEAKPPREP